uniref:Uncharacterized protein n=1 Tax=Heliothis virescens TaxID=7102 RepID=A0A2A4JCR2_HELVI
MNPCSAKTVPAAAKACATCQRRALPEVPTTPHTTLAYGQLPKLNASSSNSELVMQQKSSGARGSQLRPCLDTTRPNTTISLREQPPVIQEEIETLCLTSN